MQQLSLTDLALNAAVWRRIADYYRTNLNLPPKVRKEWVSFASFKATQFEADERQQEKIAIAKRKGEQK